MLFKIDADKGSVIQGWVTPDNPSGTSKVVVHLGPERHIAIDAFVERPLLREQGLHNTGICGFVLNERNCPGITAAADLEIKDAASQLLIYRRRPKSPLAAQKFLRIETQLLRSQSLDNLLKGRFHMPYQSLELLSEETTTSVLTISFTDSLFVSGRIFWRLWEPLIRGQNYKTGIVLRDPFEEFAERLLILKWASMPGASSAQSILGLPVQASAAAIRDVNLSDLTALQAFLTRLPGELRPVLYNPLVHQLAAPNAFDPPQAPEAAAALDSLAEINAVGLRCDARTFLDLLAAVLHLQEHLPDVSMGSGPAVRRLAEELRGMRPARALIEKDLEVYAEAARICTPPAEVSA
ncbi:MAG: hypothetical protein L0Y57_01065 [Beijerinckiaceae bacterium]|nr:hypothetical protein [Beijerinckiaceae bacterium]